MEDGDFVYIDYVGRVRDSGEIFDITDEKAVRKEGIFRDDFKYGPVPIVVGADFVLPGLTEALKGGGSTESYKHLSKKGMQDRGRILTKAIK